MQSAIFKYLNTTPRADTWAALCERRATLCGTHWHTECRCSCRDLAQDWPNTPTATAPDTAPIFTDTDPPGPVQPVRPTVQPHPGHLPVLSGLPGTPSGPVGPTARPHPNCLAQCPAPSKLALKEIHSKMHGNCCEHPVATLHIDWLGCHATAGSTCQQSVAIQSSSFLSISM